MIKRYQPAIERACALLVVLTMLLGALGASPVAAGSAGEADAAARRALAESHRYVTALAI